MIHYHGTPLTPRSEMLKMAGKHFCVSFAHPNDAEWCLQNGQSVMWDNGAFSMHTSGAVLIPQNFYAWVESKLSHPHWAVIPDVIEGGEDENDALVFEWPFGEQMGAPVWHLHESFDRLSSLIDDFPRVCFGSSAQYWQIGSDAWERRVDEAWNVIVSNGSKPWIHMLRGLSLCGDRWPFASADSVNVARNFKDSRCCPERMARRIDAIQCPSVWEKREKPLGAML